MRNLAYDPMTWKKVTINQLFFKKNLAGSKLIHQNGVHHSLFFRNIFTFAH